MNNDELGKKTTSGLLWSFIDRFSLNISAFILGIVLARLLSPDDFGLVAIVYIFIAVSRIFIDGGFSQSLIRNTDATQTDFSTMFFFNILVGSFFCVLLYHSASSVSIFFNEPILNDIVKVLSLLLIVDSVSIVSQTKLTKEINFKLQTQITVFSTVTSGILGVYLAYTGFGVWSLVYMQVSQRFLNSILLLYLGRWLPNFVFSLKSLKQMFSYGWKLTLSSLINVFQKNTHLFVIGKYFSVTDLGFYSRADKFAKLPSENIAGIFDRVSFPTLSLYQDNKPLLLENFRNFLKLSMFVNITSLLFLAAISDNLILVLIGEKWQESIVILQLLCLVVVLYPMQTLNLVLLKIEGKTDIFLYLECLKATLVIPSILICITYGINYFILALFFISLISFFINSFYSHEFIGYGSSNQLKDVLPIFVIPIFLSATIYFLGLIMKNTYSSSNLEILSLQFFIGILMFFLMNEKFKTDEYQYLKKLYKDIKQ